MEWMGKGEGDGGVEVRDKVERVCSVILACRGCFGGVMACQKNPPLPRHPTHPHTHTYTFIHLQFHQPSPPPISLPHYSPNFLCHHLLSKQTLLSTPSHPLCPLYSCPLMSFPLVLVFWPPCLRLELPLIIYTSSLSSLTLSSSNIWYILFKSKPCTSTPSG